MLEYARRAIASQFNHPLLGLMFTIAGLLALSGGSLQLLINAGLSDWRLGGGFFAVFATFFTLLGVIGYLVLYVGKYISIMRDRLGPAA